MTVLDRMISDGLSTWFLLSDVHVLCCHMPTGILQWILLVDAGLLQDTWHGGMLLVQDMRHMRLTLFSPWLGSVLAEDWVKSLGLAGS